MTQTDIRGYILSAPAKSGVGIGVPEFHRDRDTPRACFLLSFSQSHLRIMVGCVGEPKGSPVGDPVTPTLHVSPPNPIGVGGGDKQNNHRRASL
ncbi:ash family protein [Salmonella enterica]|nr:ash family protein [Salmonella enterica]EFR5870109.1 ash family protein [Salmonella enterica]EGF2531795.1 ash family protein [Salmonella enterica]